MLDYLDGQWVVGCWQKDFPKLGKALIGVMGRFEELTDAVLYALAVRDGVQVAVSDGQFIPSITGDLLITDRAAEALMGMDNLQEALRSALLQ